MSLSNPKVAVPTKVTKLPKVTRELVLEEDPDLQWSQYDSYFDPFHSSQAQSILDYNYEGHSE